MHNIFSVKHYLIEGKRIGTSGRRSSGRRSGRRLLATPPLNGAQVEKKGRSDSSDGYFISNQAD